MAVGVKCPEEYSYKYSPGYCFVETTYNALITDVGTLTSTPTVIKVSDGMSLDDVFWDYFNAHIFEILFKK